MCPEPVVRARRAATEMAGGEVLEIIATDPLAEVDVAVFCEHAGHELVEAEWIGDEVWMLIRVSPGPRQGAG